MCIRDRALGKPVYGYIPEDGSFAQRIRQRYPQTIGADGRVDTHGWNFEEFGLPLNLMLAVPAPLIVGSVRDALARIAAVSYTHLDVYKRQGVAQLEATHHFLHDTIYRGLLIDLCHDRGGKKQEKCACEHKRSD